MKKSKLLLMMSMMVVALSACGPVELPIYEEIQANETAFVIPLQGANKTDQGKFSSAEYLEEQKVATKRIYIPQTQVSTGRMPWSYKWIPTVKVLRVNRSPVTFVWEEKTGIKVESKDSIGFIVGINVSASIEEQNTAKFLYKYPSGNLSAVLSQIVKSQATEVLSREFAKYDLEGDENSPGARQQKGVIVDLAKQKLVDYFAENGVTISTFGLIGGLSYEDKEIQVAINDNFKSELEIKNALNKRLEQEEINAKNVAMATAEKEAADEFAKAAEARAKLVNLNVSVMLAEAELEKAKRWDGKLPANIMPAGSNFILGLNK